jgi:uncharacterized phage infection (PIP) family protein YhgE
VYGKVQSLESKRSQIEENGDPLNVDLNAKVKEHDYLIQSKIQKASGVRTCLGKFSPCLTHHCSTLQEKILAQVESSLKGMETQLSQYQDESKSPMADSDNRETEAHLRQLTKQVNEMRTTLAALATSRGQLETRQTILRNELSVNLELRLAAIAEEVKNADRLKNVDSLEISRRELELAQKTAAQVSSRVKEIDQEMEESQVKLRQLNQQLETIKVFFWFFFFSF